MPQRERLQQLMPLEGLGHGPVRKRVMAGVNGLLEKVLSLDEFKGIYHALPECSDPFEFLENTLQRMQIEHTLDENAKRTIPPSGPLVVVSNHPFGGLDGIVLALALSAVRKDIRILVNYFLLNIQELRPLFLPVDPFNQKGSAARNMASMRKAVRWIQSGGMLVVLPAGEVSHFTWKRRRVEDPPWSRAIGRLVQMTKAPVLPVYFEGRNSALFQVMGLVHPRLRTFMLPREMVRKGRTDVRFRIGPVISYKKMAFFKDPQILTEYLRFRTYLLQMADRKRPKMLPQKGVGDPKRIVAPVAASCDKTLLMEDLRSLADTQTLFENSNFTVCCAKSHQIPSIMREIGRLREETFRRVGEGTGNALDLDRFDNIYLHLFVWSHVNEELVGAYRLGPTLDILPRHGRKGLYSHTLFKYRPQLLRQLGPALELGRTFVRRKYQRDYFPLMLLWKGIGRFVALNPQYKTLLGAVSISSGYGRYSRQLMAAFLEVNTFSSDFSKMVRPRNPLRRNKVVPLIRAQEKLHRNDLDELSSWISSIESDGKGVPVLLKQYMKLGGKLLSFNVDERFGDTLDGLMFVDLTRTDEKVLKKYMGSEGFKRFMDYHFSGKPSSLSAHQ